MFHPHLSLSPKLAKTGYKVQKIWRILILTTLDLNEECEPAVKPKGKANPKLEGETPLRTNLS
jgi:hypothetical protein